MEPSAFLARVIDDGLDFLQSIGGPDPSHEARRFLLCIALQESGPKLDARYQNSPSGSPGPARGWWQFEQGGGTVGVLNHAGSRALAQEACTQLTVVAEPAAVWRALEGNDLLSCTFARLLVFTDPAPVPTDEDTAWDYYIRVWRPGAPHRDAWTTNWKTASDCVAAHM